MMQRLEVTAITAGRAVPSAWFRAGQLQPALAGHGIDVRWLPARVSKYPPARRWLRPFWAPAALLSRLGPATASWGGDVTWLVREMVSTLVTLEPFTRRPRVFDVDDAIWLARGSRFAARLASSSDLVIAGNAFLAEWFSRFNRSVRVVPTAVDTDRFKPATRAEHGDRVVLGWSGTSGNLRFLNTVEPALKEVMERSANVFLRVVCDAAPDLPTLPPDRVEFVKWSRSNEAESLRGMSVGLMPLDDSDWSRGKCAYKMLLYMATGIPVVSSPVGMNAEVLAAGEVGLPATTTGDWIDALTALASDAGQRRRLGLTGRNVVEQGYSIRVIAPRIAALMRDVSGAAT